MSDLVTTVFECSGAPVSLESRQGPAGPTITSCLYVQPSHGSLPRSLCCGHTGPGALLGWSDSCPRAFALAAPTVTSHQTFRSLLKWGLPARPSWSPGLRCEPPHPRTPTCSSLLSLLPGTFHSYSITVACALSGTLLCFVGRSTSSPWNNAWHD